MIPLIVLSVALLMIGVEVVGGKRKWPQVRGWWARALLLNLVQFGIAYLAASLWDPTMAPLRPWSADALGNAWGAVLGYFVITFFYYWWHRWRHEFSFLWRWFHQVHHSPQRIEIITSFYKHPFEIFVNSVMSSAILYFVVGLNPLAGAYAFLLTGLAELFYHWNIATPYWLGFIIQRPESHCVHHKAGYHTNNFADLPLWDMMFGTFENPRVWDADCGFGKTGELELWKMLKGRERPNS